MTMFYGFYPIFIKIKLYKMLEKFEYPCTANNYKVINQKPSGQLLQLYFLMLRWEVYYLQAKRASCGDELRGISQGADLDSACL